ncbi:GTP pyrophosphokinase [Reichenbachiella sp.]
MASKKELKAKYIDQQQTYEQVCLTGKELLRDALHNEGIELLHVSHRVKSFESFYEKISRKKYTDPYSDTEDICGLRVICFYINDLPSVGDIIGQTFQIQNSIDKIQEAETDRFGYRSNHYIVTLPNEPEYSTYSGHKIEVQTRTALMHTWAHIQGKLEYKKAEHTPRIFRRKLFQLSALLELADEQFQALKLEKNLFRASLTAQSTEFTPTTELNIDTFMAFMELYFPNRRESYRYSKLLMVQLINCQLNFSDLILGYNSLKDHLGEIEKDAAQKFSREEMMKVILSITNESYFLSFKHDELLAKNETIILGWQKRIQS